MEKNRNRKVTPGYFLKMCILYLARVIVAVIILFLFLFLPYDCLLHHIEDYAILIFVRHAQRIVKPKFKSVSK